jgi:hypothetical protein
LTVERDRGGIKIERGKEWRKKHKREAKKAMKTEKEITKKNDRTRCEGWEPVEVDETKKKYRLGPDLDEL